MRRLRLVHPFLIGVGPVVSLYAHNLDDAAACDIAVPILLVLAATALVWTLVNVLVKDAERSAIVVSISWLLFFTAMRSADLLGRTMTTLFLYWDRTQWSFEPAHVIGAELALCAALVAAALRVRRLGSTSMFLACFSLHLTLLATAGALPALACRSRPEPRRTDVWSAAQGISARPDIYYIILDGFPRDDVFKQYFGGDSAGLLHSLEKKGFYVARRSTASYCQTPLCLASALNGDFLDDMTAGFSTNQLDLAPLIGDNLVIRSLAPLGYKTVAFATGFDPTEHPEWDYYYTSSDSMSAFHRMLIDVTPLHLILPDPRARDPYTRARDRIRYTLDRLPDVAANPAPTFTLAHILCPHPPFLFDADGGPTRPVGELYRLQDDAESGALSFELIEHRARFRDQAHFIAREIERAIDQILAKSPEPPIILLQSDHGSGLRLDRFSLERTDLHERMSILNAYHFPGRRYEQLDDRITPVNSFRVVFNTFFGTQLTRLPDRSFFSVWDAPYRFVDVTARVRSPDSVAIE